MDYSQLSDSDLSALSEKRYDKMSDNGLAMVSQINQARQAAIQKTQPQAFQTSANQDLPNIQSGHITNNPASRAPQQNEQSIMQAAKSYTSAGLNGLIKGGSMGYVNPEKDFPSDQLSQSISQHPYVEKAGEIAGDLIPTAVAGFGAGALSEGAGALSRVASVTGMFGAKGAAQNTSGDESRLGNAAKGALSGLAGGIVSEAIPAAYGAARGLGRAINPNAVTNQANNLSELLQGKTADISPSKMLVSPSASEDLTHAAYKGSLEGNPKVSSSGEVEMPLEWVNKQKKALDYKNYSAVTGIPLQKGEDELAAANYLRDKLHSASPEISNQLGEMADTIGSKKLIKKAGNSLLKEGSPIKAAGQLSTGVGGAIIKGGLRSLMTPDTNKSAAATTLADLISKSTGQ